MIGTAAAAVAFIALFAIARLTDEAGPSPRIQAPAAEISKLAVMPFTTDGVEVPDTALAAVMTEELVVRCAQSLAPQIGVITLRSAQVFEDSDESIDQIGARLGADYLVRGSVAGAGRRLRIAVRLLRAGEAAPRWMETFEIDVAALPGWYEDVTHRLAATLGVERRGFDSTGSTPIPRTAYEEYLRGRYLTEQSDTASIELGLRILENTLSMAPRFARAHAALAQAHSRLASRNPADAHVPRAESAARQALRLDDQLVDPHLVLGRLHLLYHRDWTAARREYEEAVALSPLSARVLHAYGLFLASVGRFEEALSRIRRAVDLDPATIYASSDLALVYFHARRYDEAIAEAEEHIELFPGSVISRYLIFKSLILKGDFEAAVAPYNANAEIIGSAKLPQVTSFPETIENGIAHLLSFDADTRKGFAVDLAHAYLLQGRTEEAFEELLSSCETHRSWSLVFLAVDPRFDALRGDPRWETDLAPCLAPVRL